MSKVSRRQLICYGGGSIGTGLAATVLGSGLSRVDARDSRPVPSPSGGRLKLKR